MPGGTDIAERLTEREFMAYAYIRGSRLNGCCVDNGHVWRALDVRHKTTAYRIVDSLIRKGAIVRLPSIGLTHEVAL